MVDLWIRTNVLSLINYSIRIIQIFFDLQVSTHLYKMDSDLSICEYIEKMKNIEENLLKFLDNDENKEENYENLVKSIEDKSIRNDHHELKGFLYLLAKIANNHHRYYQFISKIEQILEIFREELKKFFSNWEIFKIFKDNKRILLYLQETIFIIDENIYQEIMKNKFQQAKYPEYFAPEIKPFIEKELKMKEKPENESNEEENDDYDDEYNIYKIYEKIKKLCDEDFNQFNEKRKNGENDGLLYKIIQNDSIEEFIIYVNKENYPLNSLVERSIFETNPFLLKENEIYLIEYAAFFGSIQIFRYLYKNNVKLTKSLWIYAIHGGNEEMIHILEENHIELNLFDSKVINDNDYSEEEDKNNLVEKDVTYQRCLKESVKCHHNFITSYIMDNFLNENDCKKFLMSYCFQYYNFLHFPKEIDNNEVFFYACKSDNYIIVHLLLKNIQKIDVNVKIISKYFSF